MNSVISASSGSPGTPPPADEPAAEALHWTRGLLRTAPGDPALRAVWHRVHHDSEEALRPVLARLTGAGLDETCGAYAENGRENGGSPDRRVDGEAAAAGVRNAVREGAAGGRKAAPEEAAKSGRKPARKGSATGTPGR
ncbi:hypothetical protein [Streptomyces sp. NPDC058773]|uniref:hypothetical protein n=1 Tax=Streptomyces sp. NPDC058773 TaxID=3346632 RepID=UPI0036B0B6A4